MMTLVCSLFAAMLMLLPTAAPASEDIEARDVNDFVVRIAKDVAGYLKQSGATEVALAPFKKADEDGEYALSEVLTGELLQELRFTNALKVLQPTDGDVTFRVTGIWKLADENVEVTVKIVKMPAGDVQINYAGRIPLKRVPKVYIDRSKAPSDQPDRGTRLAVMDFTGYETYPSLVYLNRALPEAITTYFARKSDMVLIERLQRDKIMAELSLAESKFTDPDAVVAVGKLLGANYMIVGSYHQSGRKLRIMARRVKVETGEIFEAADVTGNEDNIFDLEDELARKLLEDIQKYR